jgi:hypothetical protein
MTIVSTIRRATNKGYQHSVSQLSSTLVKYPQKEIESNTKNAVKTTIKSIFNR